MLKVVGLGSLVAGSFFTARSKMREQSPGSGDFSHCVCKIFPVAFVASRISFRIMMNLLMSCLPSKRNVLNIV